MRPEDFQATPAKLSLLDDDERAQQQRYIPQAKRHEYLVTRVLVRTVLGETLGIAPQALRFVCNEWGRPAIAPDLQSSPVCFNVSHTDGLVVCLVSTEGEVGVDVELFSRAPKLLTLATRVFAPRELSDLAELPSAEQAHRAVALWTLKESYIKARGMGLALPLDGFAFSFAGSQVCLEVEVALNDNGACWQFQSKPFGAHCISTAIALPIHKCKTQMDVAAIDYVEFCSLD